MAPELDHARFLRIVRGEDRSPAGALARAGLALAAGPYRAAVGARNFTFNRKLRRGVALGRPTISVGNLTAGGTGKTPMVVEVVTRLRRMGERPAVLLRGYGDDETHELQSLVNPRGDDVTPVEANPSRAAAAADVLAHHPGISAFVLDDAFQHRQVRRDLDLVLIDATDPFGGERLLPRGLLREPMVNLRRADAVIVTRSDQLEPEALAPLDARIESLTGHAPIAHAASAWSAWRGERDEPPLDALRNSRVIAGCGIGNPGAFERQLREHVGEVVALEVRNDHHAWTGDELAALLARARACDAVVVTTEKDWVKWRPLLAQLEDDAPVAVYRPVLTTRFLDGAERFATLLSETMRRARNGG